jgi:hypothetical protein
MNEIKQTNKSKNLEELQKMLESAFRYNSVINSKLVKEWTNLLI